MRIIPVIVYLFTVTVFYYYIQISGVKPFSLFNPEAVLFLFSSLFLTMANFSPDKIMAGLNNALRTGKPPELYEESMVIIRTVWQYLFKLTILFMVISFFYALGTSDTSKIGPFIGTMIITPLYTLILKFFIFIPLQTSLEKKLILSKKFHFQK